MVVTFDTKNMLLHLEKGSQNSCEGAERPEVDKET